MENKVLNPTREKIIPALEIPHAQFFGRAVCNIGVVPGESRYGVPAGKSSMRSNLLPWWLVKGEL